MDIARREKIIEMARGIWPEMPDDVEVELIYDTTVVMDDGSVVTLNAAFGNQEDGIYRAAFLPDENVLYILTGKTRWESHGGYKKLARG